MMTQNMETQGHDLSAFFVDGLLVNILWIIECLLVTFKKEGRN